MRLSPGKPYKIFHLFSFLVLGLIFLGILSAAPRTTTEAYAETDDSTSLIGSPHYVTIHDQGEALTIKTDALTVQDALERAHLTVEPTDHIDPTLDTSIDSDNYHINIYRSRPVIISDGYTQKYLMSASYDPATIAAEAGFTVYDGDEIALQPSSNFLESGIAATYRLTRNGGRTVTVEESIPFSEEIVKDSTLELGQTKVTQLGEDGRKVLQYQVNFIDGVEVSRELISEEVVKQPVNRITAQGNKSAIPPEWSTCAAWAREAGVSEADLSAALAIIYHESGCRVNATNSSSGAYGIPQALPGSKMASAGADWETNPVTQIKWMSQYVNRYGGWAGAEAFWNTHHWY